MAGAQDYNPIADVETDAGKPIRTSLGKRFAANYIAGLQGDAEAKADDVAVYLDRRRDTTIPVSGSNPQQMACVTDPDLVPTGAVLTHVGAGVCQMAVISSSIGDVVDNYASNSTNQVLSSVTISLTGTYKVEAMASAESNDGEWISTGHAVVVDGVITSQRTRQLTVHTGALNWVLTEFSIVGTSLRFRAPNTSGSPEGSDSYITALRIG